MHFNVNRLCVAVVAVLVGCAAPTRADDCKPSPFSAKRESASVVITVDWEQLLKCEQKDVGGRILSLRIDEDAPVDIKVTHFNFLAFTTSYTVSETVVETYVTLEKLWAQ